MLMRKLFMLILLGGCSAVAGCHSYTQTLEQSVTAADETAALAAIHATAVAEQTYATSNNGSYADFQKLATSGFLDSRFNYDKPKIKGYALTLVVTNGAEPTYTLNADPAPPQTGRHLYMDSSSGLIHVNPSQSATAVDPTLNQ